VGRLHPRFLGQFTLSSNEWIFSGYVKESSRGLEEKHAQGLPVLSNQKNFIAVIENEYRNGPRVYHNVALYPLPSNVNCFNIDTPLSTDMYRLVIYEKSRFQCVFNRSTPKSDHQ
jgi:hypothetical protein